MENGAENLELYSGSATEFKNIIQQTLAVESKKDLMRFDILAYKDFFLNGYRLTYTEYGPEPKGLGKPVIWGVDFNPTYALDIAWRNYSYLFALREDEPSTITRRFMSGSLMPPHGLPNLFTSTRPIDEEESEALLLFARSPHLNLDKIHILSRLNNEESADKQVKDSKVAEDNDRLYRDLAKIARSRRPPPHDVII